MPQSLFLIGTSSLNKAVTTLEMVQKKNFNQEIRSEVELVRKLIRGKRQLTIPIIAIELSINRERA